jgi:hypothetical protein
MTRPPFLEIIGFIMNTKELPRVQFEYKLITQFFIARCGYFPSISSLVIIAPHARLLVRNQSGKTVRRPTIWEILKYYRAYFSWMGGMCTLGQSRGHGGCPRTLSRNRALTLNLVLCPNVQ